MTELRVDLGDRSYPIYIGNNLLASGVLASHIRAKQVLIVTNETVAPLYLANVKAALQDFKVDECILPDGEQHKTLDTVATIYDTLMRLRHNRTTTIIALGGGVVGDMAGFAAASYQRGVRFIQIPTTLLSQVDSSVGGKTGVNHPMGKNMIGAFYQPDAVIVDITSLNTLPSREYAAGVAEVIKYGLIADPQFYNWLIDNRQALLNKEPRALSYAIEISCKNKAAVVSKDEREAGIRAILNLGHTFGHAIETHMGYGRWLHGEAVAAGMVVAARLSMLLGNITQDDVDQLIALLSCFGLPTSIPKDMSVDHFLSLMAIDKKAEDGLIKLIALSAVGQAFVTSDVSPEQIKQALDASY